MFRFSVSRSFSTFKHITSQNRSGAVWISFNRPKLHNAFNEEFIAEVTQAFKSLPQEARCVVLSGEGESFSAGADLNWMKKMRTYTEEENVRDSQQLFEMFQSIRFAPVPVIGRINGHALGGGAGLTACCDIAFALSSAKFGFTEVRLGLAPAVISKFVLDKIGRTHASRYFLTGDRFSASEAVRIGLVQEQCASLEELDSQVDKTVSSILSSSPQAVRASKLLIEQVSSPPSTLQVRDTVTSLIAKLRVSPEGQEGLNAFFEKRNPAWVVSKDKKQAP